MTSIANLAPFSLICLSVLPGQLFADGHLAHGVLSFDGTAVGVQAFVSASGDNDPATVDLDVTYDLAPYMSQLRSKYAGIQTLDTCGDQVVFNPPQLILAQDSGEVLIGSMAVVEDWTCSSRLRDEQHGLAWTQVDEQQRFKAATTASMNYSAPLFGMAMVRDATISTSGEPTADSILAMESLAIAVSNDIFDASESVTWWNTSPTAVKSNFDAEEYERFLEAISQSDATIDGETVRLTIKVSPELAEGWASFIASGPQSAIDLE